MNERPMKGHGIDIAQRTPDHSFPSFIENMTLTIFSTCGPTHISSDISGSSLICMHMADRMSFASLYSIICLIPAYRPLRHASLHYNSRINGFTQNRVLFLFSVSASSGVNTRISKEKPTGPIASLISALRSIPGRFDSAMTIVSRSLSSPAGRFRIGAEYQYSFRTEPLRNLRYERIHQVFGYHLLSVWRFLHISSLAKFHFVLVLKFSTYGTFGGTRLSSPKSKQKHFASHAVQRSLLYLLPLQCFITLHESLVSD